MTKWITKKTKNNNEKYDIEQSNNAIKDQVKNGKINYSTETTNSNDENFHKLLQKKTRIEIVVVLMVYGIEERGIKKRNRFNN